MVVTPLTETLTNSAEEMVKKQRKVRSRALEVIVAMGSDEETEMREGLRMDGVFIGMVKRLKLDYCCNGNYSFLNTRKFCYICFNGFNILNLYLLRYKNGKLRFFLLTLDFI